MNYADENYYLNSYLCGRQAVIANGAFDFYARSATQKIKQYTLDNIAEADIPNCVKDCCCELAEWIYADEQVRLNNCGVASESVNGWSKSYESNDVKKQALDNAVRDIVYRWLSGTGLLYRGVK